MSTKKSSGFNILHIADIHIRDNARDNFHVALEHMRTFLGNIRDGRRLIAVIAGDVFHYKTRLSAENITDCYALLDCLASRACDIIVIPGNHDANLNNDERIDLLTPIMTNCRALPNGCALHYWARSGWQAPMYDALQFYVFSPITGDYAAPAVPEETSRPNVCGATHDVSFTRIALVHDFIDGLVVHGSHGHGAILQEWLSGFHAVMCGHSHDYQSFKVAGDRSRDGCAVVYSGALTQLTIGESYDKGMVLWDFTPSAIITHRFVDLETPGAQVKYTLTASSGSRGLSIQTTCNSALDALDNQMARAQRKGVLSGPAVPLSSRAIPCDTARVIIEASAHVPADCREIKALIAGVRERAPRATIEVVVPADSVSGEVSAKMSRSASLQVQNELIEAKLRASNPQIDKATVCDVLALHAETLASRGSQAQSSKGSLAAKWTLVALEWGNLFCYGENNHINFTDVKGFAGLIAPNRCGKSSVIDILVLALFNKTLRGSTATIIRRGQREGSLRCIWTAAAQARHEVTRKWDLKGHTTINYSINGANCTEVDLKSTYGAIERSVGTIGDFLSAVLIPQHADVSFLDATDLQKRVTIARILGLDMLDEALAATKEKEKTHQAAIKGYAKIIESAVTRINAAKGAGRSEGQIARDGTSSADIARNLIDKDAHHIEEDYKAQILNAREHVQKIKSALEALEAQPSIAKPARTQDDILREIRLATTQVAKHEGEIAEIDARITAARANLALLIAENPAAKNLSIDAIDTDRAKLAQLSARVDQQMLLLGRAQGTKLDNVQAMISSASTRLKALLEMRTYLAQFASEFAGRDKADDCAGAGTATANVAKTRARFAEINAAAAQVASALTRAEIDARIASIRAEGALDMSLPCVCKCAKADSTEEERDALLMSLRCATFAPGVAIGASEVPTSWDECLARVQTIAAKISIRERARDTMEMAKCAVRMVRLCAHSSGPVAGAGVESRGASDEAVSRAEYCKKNHAAIIANRNAQAEMEYLCALCASMDADARRARKAKLIAAIIATAKEGGLDIKKNEKGDDIAPGAKVVAENIYACERALALLGELHENRARIAEAMKMDTEVSLLRTKVDTCFSLQRITLAIDGDTRVIAAIRERIADKGRAVESLKAQIEPTIIAHKEYAEFVARQGEIKAHREAFARAQTAYISLVAEANEYARIREDLRDVSKQIAFEHQANHICQLYRMALDTKTGIQYNLMTSAIHLIEEEANKLLLPIAGLRLSICLGTACVAISSAGASPASDGAGTSAGAYEITVPHLARGTVAKTMAVTVRNSKTGVEHSADLCSGFQRFILNIALRRAFLRAAVRPMPMFMIIDEGFGCLDDVNMARVCEYLPELARELSFMLIISHIDSLNTMITTPIIIDINKRGEAQNAISAITFGDKIGTTIIARIDDAAPASMERARKTAKKATARTGTGTVASAAEAKVEACDPVIVDKRSDGTQFCKVCMVDFASWARHAKTKKHIMHTAKSAARLANSST